MQLLWMMLAGALGTGARYGLTLAVQNVVVKSARSDAPAFPLGTLLINVIGSLLLSMLVTLVLKKTVDARWQLVLGTGFLGAFTTFSTFAVEAENLIGRGDWKGAALYVGGNLVLGLGAVLAGRALALRLL